MTAMECAAELRKTLAELAGTGGWQQVFNEMESAVYALADRWETPTGQAPDETFVPADVDDQIRRDERLQIARRLRANQAALLATSARTEDAIGLICHQIEFAAVHRDPQPPAADEDGLT